MISDNDIINKINNSGYINFQDKIYRKIFNYNELNYIQNRFETFFSYKENIYRIIHKIYNEPLCPVCNKRLKFIKGYRHTCSYKCANLLRDSISSLNKTVKTKYGVDNVWQNEDIKRKCEIKHLENYGVVNVSQSEEIKKKKAKTCFANYGVVAGFNNGKTEITKLNKYGSATYNNMDKNRQTCLLRYGVRSNLMLDYVRKRAQSEEAKLKRFITAKNNGTISSSKPELETFELLKTKFSDTIHQYRDTIRYPFRCDFYIPSIDTFIECQYGFFHGNRPFTNSLEDINELNEIIIRNEKLKNKSHKTETRYDKMIHGWTVGDVKKRTIAKENNLNFLEFYTFEDFKEWFDKQ